MKVGFGVAVAFGVIAAGLLCGCKPRSAAARTAKAERHLQALREEPGYTQCLTQSDPVDSHWPRAMVEAFCLDKFTPALTLADARRLLDAGQGTQLDAEFDGIVDDYLAGRLPEGSELRAYGIFASADEQTSALIDRWLVQSPHSAHALTARGLYRVERGADARGGKLFKNTAPDRIADMLRWFRLAQPDLEKALSEDPRILAASASLLELATLTSDRVVAKQALEAGLKVDPGNFYIRAGYMEFMEPRWSGTFEAMDRVASDAEPWFGGNPRLACLRAMALVERSSPFLHDQKFEDALRAYERGLALCPIPHDFEFAGRLAMKLQRDEHAVEMFSQALRFDPELKDARVNRARGYRSLHQYAAAQADLDRQLEQTPDDAYVLGEYALLLIEQKDFQGAAARLTRAHQSDPRDLWITGKLASTFIYDLHHPKEAEALVAQLLEKDPRSGAAWLMRADLLDGLGQPGLREAAENFVRYADSADGWQRSALPRIEAWLAAHPSG